MRGGSINSVTLIGLHSPSSQDRQRRTKMSRAGLSKTCQIATPNYGDARIIEQEPSGIVARDLNRRISVLLCATVRFIASVGLQSTSSQGQKSMSGKKDGGC